MVRHIVLVIMILFICTLALLLGSSVSAELVTPTA